MVALSQNLRTFIRSLAGITNLHFLPWLAGLAVEMGDPFQEILLA
jgi:hypothetical protein